MDRHVAPTAHKIGPVQLDTAGRAGDRPVHARRSRAHVASRRRTGGTSRSRPGRCVLRRHPERPRRAGPRRRAGPGARGRDGRRASSRTSASEESLDVRRAMAVGEMAGVSWRWTFSVVEEGAPRPSRNHRRQGRPLRPPAPRTPCTARRRDTGNQLVTAGQVRDLVRAASQVVVKPVLDPTPTTRSTLRWCRTGTRELIAVRDQTCVFPWCTRSARSLRHRPHRPVIAGRSHVSVQRGLVVPTDTIG